MNLLSHIQIVLINTTLPANIGSTARAMWTMGLSNLVIVAPKLPIDETSVSHASGGIEVLNNATEVQTLEEAIADSQLIFASSSRSRTMPRPVVNPTQSVQIMAEFLDNSGFKESIRNTESTEDKANTAPIISILFGREDRGLTNEELAVADYHIQIDANPAYPVLNVASAVQVIASFIYSYFYQLNQQDSQPLKKDLTENKNPLVHSIRQDWDEPAINHQQQTQLNDKIIELMQSLELADKDDLRLLPQRLSRLTSRLQLDKKEYQLINSILSKLIKDR